MAKKAAIFISAALVLSCTTLALAIDMRDVRIKRLYREAKLLEAKGAYDKAIENYSEAIKIAQDKDIRLFLVNAKKDAQQRRYETRGKFRLVPHQDITEPMAGGLSEEEKTEENFYDKFPLVGVPDEEAKEPAEIVKKQAEAAEEPAKATVELQKAKISKQDDKAEKKNKAKYEELKKLEKKAEALEAKGDYEAAKKAYEKISKISKELTKN